MTHISSFGWRCDDVGDGFGNDGECGNNEQGSQVNACHVFLCISAAEGTMIPP